MIKFFLFMLTFLSVSSCVTLSDEGAKVKVIYPRESALETLKSCERLESMKFNPGFFSRGFSDLVMSAKNDVAAIGGNVVVSKSLVIVVTAIGTGFQGVAYKCPLSAYNALTTEEDY